MNVKDQSVKLSDLNKKILEIKKKIQLSEGQRKALFEDCEDEKKSNNDEIIALKKETAKLKVALHEQTNTSASYRLRNQTKTLEQLIGPLHGKSCEDVEDSLDLLVIDKCKQLDLLRYEMKKRKKTLLELGEEYKALNNKVDKKFITVKVDIPVKKSTSELQNSIHAIEVQIREALHVKNKYLDIRKSLKDDSARFESNIVKLNEEIRLQKGDINKLQTILEEAIKMRTIAKSKLIQEEKLTASYANNREKEVIEGRKLLSDKKQELEKLEKKIFQGGKVSARPEPDGAEDGGNDEDKPPTPPHPCEILADAFEILKRSTGATNIQEVLYRFKSQKETNAKLFGLRKKSENDKRKLEKQKQYLENQLEGFRYAEVKDAERQTSQMEELQVGIQDEIKRREGYLDLIDKKNNGLKVVICGLRSMYICIKPAKAPNEDEDPLITLVRLQEHLSELLKKMENAEIPILEEKQAAFGDDENEEKWLPAPYMSLVRRTPLPLQGSSPAPPPPPGSEDEEEVPSRGYLKRQAQLVIDAKTRRKTLRVQVGKRL